MSIGYNLVYGLLSNSIAVLCLMHSAITRKNVFTRSIATKWSVCLDLEFNRLLRTSQNRSYFFFLFFFDGCLLPKAQTYHNSVFPFWGLGGKLKRVLSVKTGLFYENTIWKWKILFRFYYMVNIRSSHDVSKLLL